METAELWYRKVKTFVSTFVKLLYNTAVLKGNIGFIDCIDKWIDRAESTKLIFESRPAGWYKTFAEESELVNFDARFSGREELRLFNDIKWCLRSKVKIYYMHGAIIIGENAVVMSPSGRIFKELTYPTDGRVWRYGDFYGEVFLPALKFKVGWYTSLACPTAYNYFHWMIECLPRLAVLEKYLMLLDGIIMPADSQPFHYESLRALGIEARSLISASSQLHLKAEHFFATNYSARDNPPAWLHVWYKEKFIAPLGLKVKSGRKIYISRADAARRKASNWEEIEKMVSALGFEVIILSEISFIDQAVIFYTADIVIAEHGSGLTNLLFCRKGTKVVEIFSLFWIYPCFYAIARSAGLEYHFHLAESDQNCPRLVERMRSGPIEGLVDWDRSSEYIIDVNALQRKILDVVESVQVVRAMGESW